MSRTNIENVYPLSPMQEGMLFDTRYADGEGVYVVQSVWTLRGPLDPAALRRAWQALVDRHAVLRTGFAWERLERPLQVVRKRVTFEVQERDLRGLPVEEQAREVTVFAEDDRRRGFDLTRPPLMRVAVFRVADDSHRVVWTRHHILLDGWSTPILTRELLALHDAYARGGDPHLEPPHPYGEYIAWLGRHDRAATEAFWRRELGGMTAATPLRIDHPPAPEGAHADVRLALPQDLADRLEALSRRRQITLSTLVQGAWALLLSRYSGEREVVFGATVSGRSAPIAGIDRMVGMFINTLPVRVDVDPDAPAGAWLEGLHRHQIALREHEHSSLAEVQAWSGLPRGTTLFESVVVFENYPFDEGSRRGDGVSIADVRVSERSSVPLTLLALVRRGVTLQASYDARRFDGEAMARMLGHVATLLEGIVDDSTRPNRVLPLLTEAERRRVLVEWNRTAFAHPTDRTVPEIFAFQVDRAPDAIAVEAEGRSLSYRQLDLDANRVAHALLRRGVGPDVLVGVCMDRSIEMVVALYAVLKAGGAYVPLDPELPRERLAFMLSDARPRVILAQAASREALPAYDGEMILIGADREAATTERADRPRRDGLDLTSLAYVIYTSGSTGRPKGAMNTHGAILNRLLWMQRAFPLSGADRVIQKTPFSFDVSVWELFWPLMVGARLCVARPGGHQDPAYLEDAIVDHEITVTHFVPSMLHAFLEQDLRRCRSLRRVFASGEALPPALVERFFRSLPGVELHNLYGPTEAAVDVTHWPCSPGAALVPIGRPIDNVRVYVLDPHGEPVPVGVPGELYLGGVQVGRGYLGRDDLTAERFVRDRFDGDPRARLYRTGDVVRFLPSGDLEYLGRSDFQVKIRGLRVELGEIEAAILRHPLVREAAVVVREASGQDPGDKRLVAYVVLVEHIPVSDLRSALEQELPRSWVPQGFVYLDALPLTPSGKVDRRALPEPDLVVERDRMPVPPRGPVEEAIASVFAEVLKRPVDEIGAHDGFFELGGHSLLATQAVSRIGAALGVDLPLRAIFETPTPAGLAARAGEGSHSDAMPALVRVPRDAPLAVSFGQERLWFLAELNPLDTSYNIASAARIDGALDVDALRRAIAEVVRRHEVLRTTFVALDGKPRGVVHVAAEVPLPVLDLRPLPADAKDAALRDAILAEARAPFDLSTGPLLRTRLVALAEDEHVLVAVMHHIVSDQWSRAVYNREISALYGAFRKEAPSPLPDLAIQYADYAAWQRACLAAQGDAALLAYWTKQLDDAPRVLDLPFDRPRPAVRSSRGAEVPLTLPAQVVAALRDLARREGVTLYMILLAALDVLLFRYTGQADIVVGSPVAGRTHHETEALIGYFLNTLVMRVRLSDDISFRELVQQVKGVSLEAFAHQEMPFERLAQVLDPERDMSRSPLTQVIFNLQNAPRAALSLGEARVSAVPIEGTTTKYDLALILAEGVSMVRGSLFYSTDLFDPDTIERFTGHLQVLLARVPKGADRPLRSVSVLPDDERDRLVRIWNDTRLDLPMGETLVDLFEDQVDRTPDALALVAGGERLTFRALDIRANRLAHRLRDLGVRPDAVVGIALDRGADMIVTVLAILKAGGAYLPLDLQSPRPRLVQVLEDASARLLVTTSELAANESWGRIPVIDADAGHLAGEPAARLERDFQPEHLAYALFTSGSSGRPKGVAVEHRQIVSYLRGIRARLDLPEGARWAHVSTFAADLGNTALFPPLCFGGTLHVLPEEATRDAAVLADYFAREGIEALKIVPSHLAALLAVQRPERVIPQRLLVLGGEASAWELVERIEELAPRCRIVNHYGPTETTVGAVAYPVPPRGHRPSTPTVPLGRPLPNTHVYLLDASMNPVPLGAPGEIFIGGAGVARGYLNQPDLTAERFVKNPLSDAPGDRLYRTGDRARCLADGSLLFLGRTDFQVKIRGYRVELGEVEAALLTHPWVAEVVVLATGDSPSERGLVAYVVPRRPEPSDAREAGVTLFTSGSGEPPPLTAADLSRHVAQRLPSYMAPGAVVVLPSLPLTSNGKLDRRALSALAPRRAEDREAEAPRTPTEEILASIWMDVFDRSHVGVHDRFNDLGGHSLLAIQIIARARDAFQVDIPLRAIFEFPTISGLAAQVESARRSGEGPGLPPIERALRSGAAPLSFAQERLWFLNQLEPESAFYNVPLNMRFKGPLDPAALARALGEVMRRHEVLRTTFDGEHGEAVQVIHPYEGFDLQVESLVELPPGAREEALRRAAALEVRRPFDLRRGPLLRARLLRMGDDDHALLMTSHHIVSDAWTRGIIHRELSRLYGAISAGTPAALPDLPVQYADYSIWQRRWLGGEHHARAMSYWRHELHGAPQGLDLPTDHPRPPVQSYRGAWRRELLPAPLAAQLHELSRREGVTLFMTLLSAFYVLLYRLSGQDDLVVGTPVAGRSRPETEGLIGFFINALVLRAKLADALPFREVLRQIREVCLGAYAHQDVSFERLVQELSPSRDLGRSPLFQVLFTLQTPSRPAPLAPGLTVGGVWADNPTSKYDITLALSDHRQGLLAAIEYATDLFDPPTIDRMLRRYRALLEGVVRDAEMPVAELHVLLPDEERQVLVEWNRTEAPYPSDRCVHELFEAQARETPLATAVSAAGRLVSYRELNERANALARYLRTLGVGPEVLVGLCLERSLDLVVAILGVLKAGGAYVPIDPRYPTERVAFMLEDSATPIVLTQEKFAGELPAMGVVVLLDADWDAIGAHVDAPDDPRSGVTPDNLAYVIYTSGSTGKPKGVLIQHRGLTNYVWWAARAYDAGGGSGAPLHSSVSFDLSVTSLFAPLVVGRTVVLLPEEGEIDALVDTLAHAGGYSLVKLTPSHLEVLNRMLPAERAATSARALVIGGEALSEEAVAFWRRHAPATRLFNEYGPTETVVGCAVHDATSDGEGTGPVPIGRPIANTRLYILDARLRPVPLGGRGELYVGGVGVARGYLSRPELSAQRFVPDPFSEDSSARLYRTGDLARYRETGELEFLGRVDDQVKIRGYRVELGEVEAALAAHPAVGEVAVLAREDAPGNRQLVAYFVADDPGSVDDVRAYLTHRLPEYMVPTAWVRVDAMPLTTHGKVDRRALPAPQASIRDEGSAPRDPVEEAIADIWREVLGLPSLSVKDSFFDLGGHSLLATQVMGRIASALGAELPLQAIFEAPTVEGLAARVRARLSAEGRVSGPALARAPRDDAPLSFAQERLWFLEQLEPSSAYVVPSALRLEGRLDVSALERALGEIVRRHEVLRTTYSSVSGVPVQVVHEPTAFRLAMDAIDAASPEEARRAARLALSEDASRPFDLELRPPFRARLLRLGPDLHVLSMAMHHIVSDAWSSRILLRELKALYAAFSTGQPSPLPELPIQYADYAAWQRAWLDAEAQQRQLDYWRGRLDGAPTALDLPLDRPRAPVQSHHGARLGFALPTDLSRSLAKLARRENATLFMLLLAGFDVLLYRWSGQGDLLVGTPIANRGRHEIEGLLGLFMNTLVLRVQLDDAISFRAAIARAREAALGAYAHMDVAFEQVVAEISPERALARSPLFQVMFTLQRASRESDGLPGLAIRREAAPATTAKFDLFLSIVEAGEELTGVFEYATDLFEAVTVERLAGRLQAVLEAGVAAPEQRVGDIDVLLPAELRILDRWAGRSVETHGSRDVAGLFEAQATTARDAIALVHTDAQISYGELDHRSLQLAAFLRTLGVGPDVPVGVCQPRGLLLPLSILAVLRAGGAYVGLDHEYPGERLRFMMEDARPRVVLTHSSLAQLVPETGALVVRLDAEWARVAATPRTEAPLDRPLDGESLAYLVYTSGSTGQPKGVAMTRGPLVNLIEWQERVSPGSFRTLQFASPSFDVCFQELFSTWASGGVLVLVEEDERRDPAGLLERIEVARVERAFLPPVALYHLVEAAHGAGGLPPSLREMIVAGDVLQIGPRLAETFRRASVVLRNQYGPSETHVVTEHTVDGAQEDWPPLPPIGRPIDNARIYVLDERRRIVPIGARGELYLGGVSPGRGYFGRADLTVERFLPDPFSARPGQRMYRTGDLGRWTFDGRLEFLGRSDFQVKVRGFRVELGEIEAALTADGAVREAVVVAVDDSPGQKRLVAYVVQGAVVTSAGALRDALRARLPEHMIPSQIVFLDVLPLTETGKVNRRALPPPPTDAADGGSQPSLRGPIEEALAGIYADVLRIPVSSVGADASFFDLGGHSLLATQVVGRARASFAVELPLRALFEAPTVTALAARVDFALRTGSGTLLPPLEAPAAGAGPVLSYAQERLWVLEQLQPGGHAYTMPVVVRLRGPLDRRALEAALSTIVDRHEVLRTTFPAVEGRPTVAVHGSLAVSLSVDRLDSEDAMAEAIAAEVRRPFDLSRGPLLRARLLQISVDDHVFVVTMHHIVADGWSLGVLARELGAVYRAAMLDTSVMLPRLPIQYAAYAKWQRTWLEGGALDRQLAYWRAELEGAPHALDLPTDRARPLRQAHRGARRVRILSTERLVGLRDLSRREGVTLFMTLLAAIGALLHRITGQDDILVGVPIAGRTQPDTEGLIGLFVNTLVMRVRLADNPSFRRLLERVREASLGAYAHQDLPFERLVQEIVADREGGRSPLFQILFVLQNTPAEPFALHGLEVEPVGAGAPAAKFDISLAMSEGPKGLVMSAVYDADLFEGPTIERMLGQLDRLLEGALAADATVPELPIIGEDERQRLVTDWSTTRTEYPRDATIHAIFAERASAAPDAIAVVLGESQLTYRQLDHDANRLARHLRARGVGLETPVGLYARRSPAMVVAALAILKAGGAYLPLDPDVPDARLSFMLEDTGTAVVVAAGTTIAERRLGARTVVDVTADAPLVSAQPDLAPEAIGSGDSLAYVMYTSGSTGAPKGVCVVHRGVVRLVRGASYASFGPGETFLQLAPLAFDASTFEIWGPLLNGGRLVIFGPEQPDPARLAQVIRDHEVTTLWLTAGLFNAVVDTRVDALQPLRQLLAGGEALSVPHVQAALGALPGVRVINGYGPTEGTTFTCCQPIAAVGERSTIPIGRPIANTTAFVLDGRMEPVPVGVPGELYIGGDGLARGYLRRPDLTAERFVPDPFGGGCRLYRTGDRVRWLDDGALAFLGRVDRQVKLRGFRIEPGEIESVIASHPAVRQAAVVLREEASGSRLVAYVAPAVPTRAPEMLRRWVEERLPAYMIPASFVALDALPLTTNGKVDRRALPPPSDSAEQERAHAAPRTHTEGVVSEIWRILLELPSVGVHDDFFRLGGHSLLAMRITARMSAILGVDLPLGALFDLRTVAKVSALVDAVRRGPAEAGADVEEGEL